MKINWITTINPGVAADFSMRVLPILSRKADVTVWTYATEKNPAFEKQYAVQKFDSRFPWYRLNRADFNIVNLDICTEPSIHFGELGKHAAAFVILHGFELGAVLDARTEFDSDEPWEALSDIADLCGPPSYDYLRDRIHKPEPPRFPPLPHFLLKACIEESLGIIAHTQSAFRFFNGRSSAAVRFLPIPFALPAEVSLPRALCAKSGFEISAVGCGPNQIDQILRAFSKLEQESPLRLNLLTEKGGAKWKQRVLELNLGKRVRCLPASEFQNEPKFLDSRLVLHFPGQSFAQVSYPLLEYWSRSLACAVSDTGWFAELPGAAPVERLGGDEPLEVQLVSVFRKLIQSPEAFDRLGARGPSWLRTRHRPEEYVGGLLQFLEYGAEGRRESCRRMLVRGLAKNLGKWLDPGISPDPRFFGRVEAAISFILD